VRLRLIINYTGSAGRCYGDLITLFRNLCQVQFIPN